MAIDVSPNCTVSVAGIHVPANVSNTGPDITRGLQKVVLALGLANNLVGYTPSASAKSGFVVMFDIPYAVTDANIAAMLDSAGVAIAMQFGSAGGVSLAGCQWFDAQITATAGSGNLSAKLSYEATSMPVVGATVSAMDSSTDVYKGVEIVSCTAISGTTYTDIDSFTMALSRNLAKAGRNNPTGRPKHIKGTSTEARMTAKYLKDGDQEGTAYMAGGSPNYCATIGDVVVVVTQACAGSPVGLTFTTSGCQYENWPKPEADQEGYIWETISAVSNKGAYSFS